MRARALQLGLAVGREPLKRDAQPVPVGTGQAEQLPALGRRGPLAVEALVEERVTKLAEGRAFISGPSPYRSSRRSASA